MAENEKPNEQHRYSKETTVFILKEKIADMMKYGKKAVANFPRREKQTADEIRASMLKLYRLAVVIEKKYYKKTTLEEIDIELEVLRHLIRFAQDKDYYDANTAPPLPFKKYEHWSLLISEIGRIIGGYMKAVK
ncbi:MAG: diversity-generating retroelement protein Avd [Oscillospiraceae bacterium]